MEGKKNIDLKNLQNNSLEDLEYFVRFIPANSPLRKSIIVEILKKKNSLKEDKPKENKKDENSGQNK